MLNRYFIRPTTVDRIHASWIGDAIEPLADLSKSGALGIRKAHTGWEVRPEDAIFCDQILILEQEFLL